MSERIDNIQKAVEKLAEYPATHLESVPVTEGYLNQIVWEGVVEKFSLEGHAKAKHGYGWQRDKECTAVLEIPPVDSPNTAVRAAIAAEAKKA